MKKLENRQPTLHITCLSTEFNADLYDLTFVRLERFCISFLFDLQQGFFGCTIQLEFEYIHIFRSSNDGISSTFCAMHFCLCKLSSWINLNNTRILFMYKVFSWSISAKCRTNELFTMSSWIHFNNTRSNKLHEMFRWTISTKCWKDIVF